MIMPVVSEWCQIVLWSCMATWRSCITKAYLAEANWLARNRFSSHGTRRCRKRRIVQSYISMLLVCLTFFPMMTFSQAEKLIRMVLVNITKETMKRSSGCATIISSGPKRRKPTNVDIHLREDSKQSDCTTCSSLILSQTAILEDCDNHNHQMFCYPGGILS